jgi:hypothetical protein
VKYYRRRISFVIPDEAELQRTIHGEEIRLLLGATRRLLNFVSLASAAGDHGRGGNSKTASRPEWSVAAITVPNGGFKQFFYNHLSWITLFEARPTALGRRESVIK